MNAAQYEKWTRPLRDRSITVQVLYRINEYLKYICCFLYAFLLIFLFQIGSDLLLREILVPGILFVAVSVFRKVYDAPRPYEVLDINPLVFKATRGKSFPSRHAFSVFMVAMCWLAFNIPTGACLMVAGVFMAVCRVLGGVHFPKDVLAGAAIAIAGGFVGFWLIP
jgi:phosphatidylglycerophosphatase B